MLPAVDVNATRFALRVKTGREPWEPLAPQVPSIDEIVSIPLVSVDTPICQPTPRCYTLRARPATASVYSPAADFFFQHRVSVIFQADAVIRDERGYLPFPASGGVMEAA